MPHDEDETQAPQDWEKAYSVGYLRLTGSTQEEAGKEVSVCRDTVMRWESCSWWKDVLAEASRRWLSGLEAKARKTLEEGLDPVLSLKILERRIPELAPATTRTDVTTDGKPLDSLTIQYVKTPKADEP